MATALDWAEVRRRAKEATNVWWELLGAVGGDVAVTAITYEKWTPIQLLGAIAVVSALSFLLTRQILIWWARFHTVPIEIYQEELERTSKRLAEISESRPRLRAETMVTRRASDLYTKTQFWGLRVHNDGTVATFEAKVRVTEDHSTSLQYRPEDTVLGWGDTRDSQKELLNGASCDLQFCAVELLNPTMPDRARLWVDASSALSPKIIWESMSMVGANEEPYATIAVSIYSKPAMVDGPRRLTLRLERDGLKMLSGAEYRSASPV